MRPLRRKREHIERADQISWTLLLFALVRCVAWVIMMGLVGLGLLGVPGFAWAAHLAALVWFVSLISFYANAATDLDTVTSAWAAVRAGRAHSQGVDIEAASADRHASTLERIEALAELIHDHQLRSEK